MNMSRIATGMVIGGIVGVSSFALMNLDRRDMRKLQRRGKQLMNKTRGFMDGMKGFM